MPRRTTRNIQLSPEATNDEVVVIISEELPHWKLACDNSGADTVLLEQRAFGKSLNEIFLMHFAIRYAGIVGKTVIIIP